MNKINRVLLMFIAMVSIMLLAVGIDRGMNYLEEKEWESQREAFYQQSRADIHKMQTTIQTLSEDPAALTAYMEENGLNYMEEEEEGTGEGAEEEQTQYRKRAKNTVLFYVFAESVWQIKEIVFFYYGV